MARSNKVRQSLHAVGPVFNECGFRLLTRDFGGRKLDALNRRCFAVKAKYRSGWPRIVGGALFSFFSVRRL